MAKDTLTGKELPDLVRECCVCFKLENENKEWWLPSKEEREQIYKNFRITSGYCSPECTSKGTRVEIEKLRAFFPEQQSISV